MTVQELIEELESIDNKDMEVMFSYNYGDYWNTKVAKEIEQVCDSEVEYSDYHQMMKIAHEPEQYEIEEGIEQNKQIVLILS